MFTIPRSILDENLCRKKTLNKFKVKLLKISGCWYKAKPYIDKHSLLSLHYSYIIPILTTEILHEEVQSRQNLTKYAINRNMLSELFEKG